MHSFARTLWNSLRNRTASRRAARRPVTRRLELEPLEVREVPAALGSLTARAFYDANANGIFDAGDTAFSTVPVTLSGPAGFTATTGANGTFTFTELPAGTYKVSFNVPGYTGSGVVSNIKVGEGQNVSVNVPFTSILPTFINQNLFLNDSGANPFRFIAPTVTKDIANQSLTVGSSSTIDLAGNFGSADITTSQVLMNITSGGTATPLHLNMFDAQTPQTVANFYDYVNSGSYNNAVFTRLMSGFVLQGGGATFSGTNPNGKLTAVTKLPAVASEHGISNTKGTIALAQPNSDINGGTDEFFFNLVNNTGSNPTAGNNLDALRFTVFGQLNGQTDQDTLAGIATTQKNNVQNMSSSPAAAALPGTDISTIPLPGYNTTINPDDTPANFPAKTTTSNYVLLNSLSVNRPDFLTYSVVSNSNPSVVTARITNEHLTLTGVGVGSSVVTVQATDQFGKSVQTTIQVTVA
jgi:cyclophilin family peptidyl-prolyl cis-trans isomerase